MESSPITQAYVFARRAEEKKNEGRLLEACKLHNLAAVHFEKAKLLTSNQDILEVLDLLHRDHVKQETRLKKFLDVYKRRHNFAKREESEESENTEESKALEDIKQRDKKEERQECEKFIEQYTGYRREKGVSSNTAQCHLSQNQSYTISKNTELKTEKVDVNVVIASIGNTCNTTTDPNIPSTITNNNKISINSNGTALTIKETVHKDFNDNSIHTLTEKSSSNICTGNKIVYNNNHNSNNTDTNRDRDCHKINYNYNCNHNNTNSRSDNSDTMTKMNNNSDNEKHDQDYSGDQIYSLNKLKDPGTDNTISISNVHGASGRIDPEQHSILHSITFSRLHTQGVQLQKEISENQAKGIKITDLSWENLTNNLSDQIHFLLPENAALSEQDEFHKEYENNSLIQAQFQEKKESQSELEPLRQQLADMESLRLENETLKKQLSIVQHENEILKKENTKQKQRWEQLKSYAKEKKKQQQITMQPSAPPAPPAPQSQPQPQPQSQSQLQSQAQSQSQSLQQSFLSQQQQNQQLSPQQLQPQTKSQNEKSNREEEQDFPDFAFSQF